MHAKLYQHTPVMAAEVLEYLAPAAGRVIVDCTLGGGGHVDKLKSQSPKVKIIAFDRDAEALAAARQALSRYHDIEYIQDNFANLKEHLKKKVDGFLFDLGVSSHQLDEPARGFSLREDGPLDMRMDRQQPLTAGDIVNTWPVEELTRLFREYGEERFAARIARSIVRARGAKGLGTEGLRTTGQLKEIIEPAIPTWKKRESVTRVFQALRIAVNDELSALPAALAAALPLLKPGGRLVVLAYHSLEDRIVKHAFRAAQQAGIITVLTKKPLTAGPAEREANPRAASAKLRAAVKL
jgi:16S rRNA (cytosine1402-N4)-methyltransferase